VDFVIHNSPRNARASTAPVNRSSFVAGRLISHSVSHRFSWSQ
jgi:hypothetical protein